jgi:hypothetical protein
MTSSVRIMVGLRNVKVVNNDGFYVTTKVVTKQLHYMPITPILKRLFLSEKQRSK